MTKGIVRITVTCPECKGTLFEWKEDDTGYNCTNCDTYIGDDPEMFPLHYEKMKTRGYSRVSGIGV